MRYKDEELKLILSSEDSLSEEVVMDSLNSTDPLIRFSCVNHYGWKASNEQMNEGLQDPVWMLRVAWSRRPELQACESHAVRGINDDNWMVRLAWASNYKWVASQDQIRSGLLDPEDEVAAQWVQRPEWTPSIDDINSGFNSESRSIRDAWKHKVSTMQDVLLKLE